MRKKIMTLLCIIALAVTTIVLSLNNNENLVKASDASAADWSLPKLEVNCPQPPSMAVT